MRASRLHLPILYRDTSAGWIAGVCAGIGAIVGVKPILVRVSFLLAGYLFPLAVFPAYLIAIGVLRDRSRTPQESEGVSQELGSSTDYRLLQRRLTELEAQVTTSDAELRRRFRDAGLT